MYAGVLRSSYVVVRQLNMLAFPSYKIFADKLTTPSTLMAYVPGAYPCKRCHLATQLLSGSAMEIMPSKTALVQSWTTSEL